MLQAPVVDHAEVDRAGLGLVVTDVDVSLSATDIFLGVDVCHNAGTLHQVERDSLAEVTIRFGGSDIAGTPQSREKR